MVVSNTAMVGGTRSPPRRCTVKRSVSSLFKIDRFQATYGKPPALGAPLLHSNAFNFSRPNQQLWLGNYCHQCLVATICGCLSICLASSHSRGPDQESFNFIHGHWAIMHGVFGGFFGAPAWLALPKNQVGQARQFRRVYLKLWI